MYLSWKCSQMIVTGVEIYWWSVYILDNNPWEKNWPPWLLTVSSLLAHGELTLTKMVTASRDLGCDWAVT